MHLKTCSRSTCAFDFFLFDLLYDEFSIFTIIYRLLSIFIYLQKHCKIVHVKKCSEGESESSSKKYPVWWKALIELNCDINQESWTSYPDAFLPPCNSSSTKQLIKRWGVILSKHIPLSNRSVAVFLFFVASYTTSKVPSGPILLKRRHTKLSNLHKTYLAG